MHIIQCVKSVIRLRSGFRKTVSRRNGVASGGPVPPLPTAPYHEYSMGMEKNNHRAEAQELKEKLKEALHEDDPIKASRAARKLFGRYSDGEKPDPPENEDT